jgi:ABC-type lipoprotein export system ATPase subunit
MAVLEVKNLSKRFGNTLVLDNISFSLEKGEVLAIIGSSGSGKTTLLRCLCSLEKPDSGLIIKDNNIKVGLVFQSFNLFPHYTAFENIVLAPGLAAKNKEAIMEEINREGLRLLEQTGLGAQKDLYPHQLSGGQQQRVAIARAIVNDPAFILADEPTGNLDTGMSLEIMGLFQQLNRQGKTIIMVTHEPELAAYTRRVITLRDGELVSDEKVKEPRNALEDLAQWKKNHAMLAEAS